MLIGQVEYHEFLWLQLQAYHAGRSLEEQDNYLEQSRRDVDKVLDEVINFKFDAKNGICKYVNCKPVDNDSISDADDSIDDTSNLDENNREKDDDDDNDDEFLTFKTSFDKDALTSSPRIEKANKNEDITETSIENNIQDLKISEEKPPEIGTNSKTEKKEEKVFNLSESRNKKIAAMHEISALIQKIESVEALYPNTKALMNSHPKYKEIRFTRNLEALLLWLNINKELYHRLVVLADWIEIDPDDVINWKDWFDCGLGLLSSEIQIFNSFRYIDLADFLLGVKCPCTTSPYIIHWK